MDMEMKTKATLAVSFFLISMLIVGLLSFEEGKQVGYIEGYFQADQDWKDYLNEVWGPFVDCVYREGYIDGFREGFLSGFIDAWIEYGAGESFRYPHDSLIP